MRYAKTSKCSPPLRLPDIPSLTLMAPRSYMLGFFSPLSD